MTLTFATSNKNKAKELNALLNSNINIQTLVDIGFNGDIPETSDTLEGNALLKAKFVTNNFNLDCFADDTGLEITVLNGSPGVYSARYAGEEKSSDKNMDKVLREMEGALDRTAQFRTVISLIINNKEYLFEGICKGEITQEKSGSDGFGYDPIFKPEGYEVTFAEMSLEEKNKISHRGIAVRKLVDFLNSTV